MFIDFHIDFNVKTCSMDKENEPILVFSTLFKNSHLLVLTI